MRKLVKQVEYDVEAPDGSRYWPQVFAEQEREDDVWKGYVEFTPLVKGDVLRGRAETSQSKLTDVEYWATGLEPVFFEGALARACHAAQHPSAVTSTEVDDRDYLGKLNSRAEVLRRAGEVERAMTIARRVLGASPQHPDALWVLAIAHASRGDRAAAKSCITQFLTVTTPDDPRRPEAEVLLAEVDDAIQRAAGM
jgi:hypothetical protein